MLTTGDKSLSFPTSSAKKTSMIPFPPPLSPPRPPPSLLPSLSPSFPPSLPPLTAVYITSFLEHLEEFAVLFGLLGYRRPFSRHVNGSSLLVAISSLEREREREHQPHCLVCVHLPTSSLAISAMTPPPCLPGSAVVGEETFFKLTLPLRIRCIISSMGSAFSSFFSPSVPTFFNLSCHKREGGREGERER